METSPSRKIACPTWPAALCVRTGGAAVCHVEDAACGVDVVTGSAADRLGSPMEVPVACGGVERGWVGAAGGRRHADFDRRRLPRAGDVQRSVFSAGTGGRGSAVTRGATPGNAPYDM